MKKKHVALITIMTALSITACGGAKEADTTTEVQQPQAAVETAADVAETEKADAVTETTEAVETSEADKTTEVVETETEVTVSADSKLDVKIIGTCPYELSDGENVLVFSFTNVSDEDIAFNPWLGETLNTTAEYQDDYVFRPGETDYGIIFPSSEEELEALTEDKLHAGLDEICHDVVENVREECVMYTTEFTSDEFSEAASLIEKNLREIGEPRLVMCYKNDELVGVTRSLGIEGDSLRGNLFDADRIVIFWCEWVDLVEQ